MKTLFPPIVPANLPAFDGTEIFKYYFKPSSANTMEQVGHLQLTLVRMDTNKTILKDTEYPLGIVFKKKDDIKYDEAKGYCYVELDGKIFPELDMVYKVQIRLGEEDISSIINDSKKLGEWLKKPETLNKISEWSIVTYTIPITKPDFGIQSFETGIVNRIDSTGYVFTGFYEPKDKYGTETLSSYVFNLYTFTDVSDKSTWKLLSSSGEKRIGQYEKVNITHIFNYELLENSSYIVTLSVKTKNLYVETKVYEVLSASYPVLEMFNSIDVIPNKEEAKMDVTIRAKQILMKPGVGTKIRYLVDDPGHEAFPDIKGTHAIIDGSVDNSKDFILSTIDGVWICQFKAMFSTVWDSQKEAIDNAIVVLEDYEPGSPSSDYLTRVSIGAMKINLAYPTNINLEPTPEYEYRFVIKKEIMIKNNGRLTTVLSQSRIIRQPEIESYQEYYFYVKENNGLLEVNIDKTYKSKKKI